MANDKILFDPAIIQKNRDKFEKLVVSLDKMIRNQARLRMLHPTFVVPVLFAVLERMAISFPSMTDQYLHGLAFALNRASEKWPDKINAKFTEGPDAGKTIPEV